VAAAAGAVVGLAAAAGAVVAAAGAGGVGAGAAGPQATSPAVIKESNAV